MILRSVARAERRARAARGLAAALVLLLVLVRLVPCHAQSAEPVALEWNAPAGCSTARDVLLRVRKLSHSSELAARQLQAEATIASRDAGQLHLKLIVRSGNLVGERNIAGRTCEDLAGATAVVLALLLRSAEPLGGGELNDGGPLRPENLSVKGAESSATGGDERTQSTTAARVGDDSKPPPEPAPAESNAGRLQRRWHGVIQLPLVSIGVGPLPRPSFGFSLAGGARFERAGRRRRLAQAGAQGA
jgi:hypothetical protein